MADQKDDQKDKDVDQFPPIENPRDVEIVEEDDPDKRISIFPKPTEKERDN